MNNRADNKERLMPDGVTSTGGRAPVPAHTPAGHLSNSNADVPHGTACAGGGVSSHSSRPAAAHPFPPCGAPRDHGEEIANARAGF